MSRKRIIWICACITFILTSIALYQQGIIKGQSSGSTDIKSVRQQELQQPETQSSGSSQTGGETQTTTPIISNTKDNCVTSYQALIDRTNSLGELSDSDLAQGLADIVGLSYCNGSTPKESDFLTITSNGQTISYDTSTSGGSLNIDTTSVVPDFVKNCTNDCPTVQAIRTARSDNKYLVLETSKPRDYQSSFRLISTSNGSTMLYWSALSFVDPMASYVWSKDGHFVFISSDGRNTSTYIVQPKGFPKTTQIPDETDTPIALSAAGDILIIMYDRNPSNTDLTDRYTKTYNIDELNTTTAGSGVVQ